MKNSILYHSNTKRTIIILLFNLSIFNSIAQTTYTFENKFIPHWDAVENWSPSYPGLTILEGDTVIINSACFIFAEVINNGSININYSENMNYSILNRTNFINNGTVTISDTSPFVNWGTMTNNGMVINDGTLENGLDGIITNSGTIVNNNTMVNKVSINNDFNGVITNIGTLDNYEEINNNGVINTQNGSMLNNMDTLNNQGMGSITNGGSIVNSSNGALTNSNVITNENYIGNGGTILNITGGSIVNSKDLYIEAGGVLFNNSILSNNTATSNLGNAGVLINQVDGTLTNKGFMTNILGSPSKQVIQGNKQGGKLVVPQYDDVTLINNGVYNNEASGQLTNEGTVGGTGIIIQNGIINNGLASVFAPGNSIGTFTNTGDLDLGSATLISEIDGGAGTSDLFVISGEALLTNANLAVQWVTAPVANSMYTIMTYGSRTDAFSTVTIPPVAGFDFVTDYTATAVTITAVIRPLGLNNPNLIENISMYPNPVTEKLQLAFGKRYDNIQINVINTLGQSVLNTEFIDRDQVSLDIKGNAGIYFVQIATNDGKTTSLKISKK